MYRSEERFHERVVVGGGDFAHRAHQAGFSKSGAEQPGGELGASVGVDHGPDRVASPAGHVDRVDDQLGAQVIGDRPPTQRRENISITAAQ